MQNYQSTEREKVQNCFFIFWNMENAEWRSCQVASNELMMSKEWMTPRASSVDTPPPYVEPKKNQLKKGSQENLYLRFCKQTWCKDTAEQSEEKVANETFGTWWCLCSFCLLEVQMNSQLATENGTTPSPNPVLVKVLSFVLSSKPKPSEHFVNGFVTVFSPSSLSLDSSVFSQKSCLKKEQNGRNYN